ncbi:hypothetical protein Y032_0107g3802 [Ancylostoma ceylanicum]|uniref:G-protein coupled receptors family 1 profile domain-containing protein n=1 Tax=Ancylostoma ceylanicum TaxID=53326 RepID=A0A016TFK6_9BILA|nr:hypothetical protein Y032_0107g3802 [Ancylostoma ceylanicum]
MDCKDPPIFDVNNNLTANVLQTLFLFQQTYSEFHRYIAVLLCLFGLLANSIHIWVLTRPRMRFSSVHTVLVCIAISDMGTMTSYMIYMTRFEFMVDHSGYPYGWALFLKIHVVISIALHAITLYLVVLMAFIRFSAMRLSSSEWLRSERALIAAGGIALSVFVLCVPTLLAHEIFSRRAISRHGEITTRYSIKFSEMMLENGCLLMKGNLWLTGIFLKAIPCVLLFWFTIALIGRMKENKEKRTKLLKTRDEKGKRDVTTYMLVFMVTVFLITELPQGVMAVLNALYTSQFHDYVYRQLADVLDLLSLINCYVAFLVYVCTSSRYRQTLLSILPHMPKILSTVTSRQNTLKREKLPYTNLNGTMCTVVETPRPEQDQLL